MRTRSIPSVFLNANFNKGEKIAFENISGEYTENFPNSTIPSQLVTLADDSFIFFFSAKALSLEEVNIRWIQNSIDTCRVHDTATVHFVTAFNTFVKVLSISFKISSYQNNISLPFMYHTITSETISTSNA